MSGMLTAPTLRLPATTEIRVMAALYACERNMTHRPSAEDWINHHIDHVRYEDVALGNGESFGAWTVEGDAAFRARRGPSL